MSETETKEVIITNKEELKTYNEMLLNGFLKYLSDRQKKKRDVVYVGIGIALMQDENFVKDFLENIHLD